MLKMQEGSDLKKTTAVLESLSTTSTTCSVTEITSLLQDLRFVPSKVYVVQNLKYLHYC